MRHFIAGAALTAALIYVLTGAAFSAGFIQLLALIAAGALAGLSVPRYTQ